MRKEERGIGQWDYRNQLSCHEREEKKMISLVLQLWKYILSGLGWVGCAESEANQNFNWLRIINPCFGQTSEPPVEAFSKFGLGLLGLGWATQITSHSAIMCV